MPHQDMIIEKATVVKWLKKVGDRMAEGEGVVEAETDKAVGEIEAPAAGVLVEVLAPAGTEIALGDTLGTIRPE